MHQGKELQVLKVRKREGGCRGQRRFVPVILRLVNSEVFQIAQLSQRTATPRRRISMSQGSEEESTSSTTVQDQASKKEQEEGSSQSSTVESSQELRSNKRNKLRKLVKSKRLKISNTQGRGVEFEVGSGLEMFIGERKQEVADENLAEADVKGLDVVQEVCASRRRR